MRIREMSAAECASVLERSEVGRLACARDAQPYIVPIHFAYDGEQCYGLTTAGQKIDWMRSNPRVCLEVDERSSNQRWLSIVIMGRYEELPETAACEGARAHALELLQRRELWWQPASVARRGREQRAPIFYRIHIMQMTGLCVEPDAIEMALGSSD